MKQINLQWKPFNVDLQKLDQDLRALYPSYVGNQAHAHLELWFQDEVTDQDQVDIQAMWDGLTETSPEAVSYKSQAQVALDQQAKKDSAKAKLLALGLDEAEIKALLGV